MADEKERKWNLLRFQNIIIGVKLSIDATNTDSFGRYVNDLPHAMANSVMQRKVCGRDVHLCLEATRDIASGEEIRYDYVRGGKVDLETMPWRKAFFKEENQDVDVKNVDCDNEKSEGDSNKVINGDKAIDGDEEINENENVNRDKEIDGEEDIIFEVVNDGNSGCFSEIWGSDEEMNNDLNKEIEVVDTANSSDFNSRVRLNDQINASLGNILKCKTCQVAIQSYERIRCREEMCLYFGQPFCLSNCYPSHQCQVAENKEKNENESEQYDENFENKCESEQVDGNEEDRENGEDCDKDKGKIYQWIEAFAKDILQKSSDENYIQSKIFELEAKIMADKAACLASASISNPNDVYDKVAENKCESENVVRNEEDREKEKVVQKKCERKQLVRNEEDRENGEDCDKDKEKDRSTKCPKYLCPFCEKEFTNLKVHAMLVHKVPEDNAAALKSQYNHRKRRAQLPDDVRKSKKRCYKKRFCPVIGCSKIVVRIENHLKNAHKIKDEKLYKKYLEESKDNIVKELPQNDSSTEYSSNDEESDYRAFQRIVALPNTINYLKRVKDVPVDSEDSEDEDWVEATSQYWDKKKKERAGSSSNLEKEKKSSSIEEPAGSSGIVQNKENFPQFEEPARNGGIVQNKEKSPFFEEPARSGGIVQNKEKSSPFSELTRSVGIVQKKDKFPQFEEPTRNLFNKEKFSSFEEPAGSSGIVKNKEKFPQFEEPARSDEIVKNKEKSSSFAGTYESLLETYADGGSEESDIESDDEDDCIDDEDHDINVVMMPWKTSVFDEFQNWLQSPDGASKSLRQAKQHSQQTQVIFRKTSEETFAYKYLFDRKALRDRWLVYIDSNRRAGTVKSYLYSLRFFYKFIQTDHPDTLIPFENKCNEMINIVTNWIAVYRKKQKMDGWKNELKQLEEMISSSDVKKFDEAEHVRYCKDSLNSFYKKSDLTSSLFANVRDYIMISICLDNASRSGSIANMTIGEFKRAKHQNNTYQVLVINHKTVNTSGPAVLTFPVTLYQEAEKYLQHFRNALDGIAKGKDSSFFVSWNGNQMSSSMVTTQLHSFWGKTVGHTSIKPRFNATKVRKFAVTKVYGEKPEMKKDLAMMMCHSENTASKSYFLQNKTKQASKTSSDLRELMRSREEPNEIEELSNIFKDCIDAKKITLTIVRERRGKMKGGQLDHLDDIQLRDKIRYMIKGKPDEKDVAESENEENIETATVITSVTSMASSGRQRVDFSPQDKDLIFAKFGMLITGTGTIRESMVNEMIERDTSLLLLKDKYGVHRLVEKVRTERKKFNKERC